MQEGLSGQRLKPTLNTPRFMVFCLLVAVTVSAASAQITQYNEAPQLAQQVEAGQLPPVQERLPVNPLVVPVLERIGMYGGDWRTALVGGSDTSWLDRTIHYENLMRWTPDWQSIIPNIAESVEVNDSATDFTFHLREGMKWSDGYPFTADDIMFWYEDVLLHPELTPSQPAWLVTGNEPVIVTKHDDYTVTFAFEQPNGLFLQNLAAAWGKLPTVYPRHYLETFHSSYNPQGIEALTREAGVNSWIDLFGMKSDFRTNGDLPVLFAWRWTSPYGAGVVRAVAERNPYYWKVDSEGNQLPYLDRVLYDMLEDPEVLLLKALAGEVDMMDRHIGALPNKAILFDNQERGEYRFFEVVPSQMNTMMILLNLNHKDPIMREIFQNKDFRIGLSHAIDRQEIIDIVFVGQGEPWQGAPQREAIYYNEQLAKQYTEFDVGLANEYLDRAGYSERDREGFRLGPDGERISFVVEVVPALRPQQLDALELVQLHWRDVGIEIHIRSVDRSLYYTRKEANEHDAIVMLGSGGLDAMVEARHYFPFSDESSYAQAWQAWYNDPASIIAEEPPDIVKQQMELYDQLKVTGDFDQQIELLKEILQIAADQFYVIGTSSLPNNFGIVKNNFRNVPESMPGSGGAYPQPAPTNPEQYFIDRSLN